MDYYNLTRSANGVDMENLIYTNLIAAELESKMRSNLKLTKEIEEKIKNEKHG